MTGSTPIELVKSEKQLTNLVQLDVANDTLRIFETYISVLFIHF